MYKQNTKKEKIYCTFLKYIIVPILTPSGKEATDRISVSDLEVDKVAALLDVFEELSDSFGTVRFPLNSMRLCIHDIGKPLKKK